MTKKKYSKHQDEIENSHYQMCIENAKKYGISEEAAKLCDMSNPLCPECPFEKED